jgi:hypothetical protein
LTLTDIKLLIQRREAIVTMTALKVATTQCLHSKAQYNLTLADANVANLSSAFRTRAGSGALSILYFFVSNSPLRDDPLNLFANAMALVFYIISTILRIAARFFSIASN